MLNGGQTPYISCPTTMTVRTEQVGVGSFQVPLRVITGRSERTATLRASKKKDMSKVPRQSPQMAPKPFSIYCKQCNGSMRVRLYRVGNSNPSSL